jgi:hypothetical protein
MKPTLLLMSRLPDSLIIRLREHFHSRIRCWTKRIGRAVALRAQAFGMSIAYTGRTPKADVPYRWCNEVQALAA